MIEYGVSPIHTGETRIDPAIVAWLRLARVYQKIDRRTAETMKQHGLSVSRFDVLNHAGTPEGRTQQELAAALLVTKGNVTQLIDAMERDGLLERRRDGRSKRVYLTDAGRALRSRAVAIQEASITAEFSVLNATDQHALLRILRTLDRAIEGPSQARTTAHMAVDTSSDNDREHAHDTTQWTSAHRPASRQRDHG